MSVNNSLIKLIIRSFSDNKFTDEDSSRKFYTPINPETFTQSLKVSVDSGSGQGNQGSEVKYKSTLPEELKLDFILDGTGTMEGYTVNEGSRWESSNKPSVHDQLARLKKCVYDMDGVIHRPRFLIVLWGSEINFRCVLTNLELNYTLFNPDGTPLRVKVSATFLAHKSREEIQAEARTNSPDLTHYNKVNVGDRLDLMTFKVYNDPKYFLQVAKANSLVNLRYLKPASELLFPPFNKKEA